MRKTGNIYSLWASFKISSLHFNIFAQITVLKKVLIIFLLSFFCLQGFAQNDSSVKNRPETIVGVKPVMISPVTESLRSKNKFIALKKDSVKRKSAAVAVPDSAFHKDSLAKALVLIDSLKLDSLKQDSVKKAAATALERKLAKDTSTYKAIMAIPYLPFNKPPLFMVIKEKLPQGKDELFYLLTGLIFLVALIRLAFPKYFNTLFLLSFQTKFRQRQTKEQLLQDNLASLMMNILFFVSGGIYIGLIAQTYNITPVAFWWLLLYCSAILGIIYAVKFLFLRFSGWIFNVKEAADTYIFIVFMSNKIIGILLIPFLLILAFSSAGIAEISITVSLILVGIMLLYRYLVSLGSIRQDLKVNALHFFLYLCAVEILPLLLIYKLLFNYIGNNI